jgi:cytochrome c oxidase accessory protein FixG
VTVHLKLYDKASSLRADGSRNYVQPADVSGRFDLRRKVVFGSLIVWLVLLPVIQLNGHPAMFLDMQHRCFYLFGATFNAQDVWLLFFLLTGVGYALIVATALWGRVWCGYACPQTVFLEGVFRPIERLIEGPRNERMRRNAGPLSFDKLWRKTLKHALFLVLSFLVAHIIAAYFVSLPALYRMVLGRPSQHPEAFAWAFTLTAVLYFDFFWFREQLCLVICPYGRLQSVLTDQDTLVIGYDNQRGEPRGKKQATGVGDCVDCNRCVVVCPTGIDIRNGLQIDCIGCARCIDACDDVMAKLDRPKGLIRYDSQHGLARQPTRLIRPRVLLYAALGVVGLGAASLAFSQRAPFEANLIRLRDMPPFVVDQGRVRNAFEIHVVNKTSRTVRFELHGVPQPDLSYVVSMPQIVLPELHDQRIPVFIDFTLHSRHDGDAALIELKLDGQTVSTLRAPLLGP